MAERNRLQRHLAVIVATLFLLMAGVTLLMWGTRDSGYAAQFENRVRADVPLGSSEQHVLNWLQQNCRYLPTKLAADSMDTIQGRRVTELAGMPEADVTSCIRSTVPREDWVSDYVRVYFFLDQHDKVIGHYFLTFEEIAEMEARLSSLPLLPPLASPAVDSAP